MSCSVMPGILFKGQTFTVMLKLKRAAFHSWLRTANQPILPGYACSNHIKRHHHHHHPYQQPMSNACLHHFQTCIKHNPIRFSIGNRKIHISSINRTVTSCTTFVTYLPRTYSRLRGDKKDRIFLHPTRTGSQQSGPLAANPLLKLQLFVPQPILQDNELIFTPSEEDIVKASALFVPSARHRIEYVKGAYNVDEAPDYKLPEIAFIGRSNVGKSSLIKELFSQVKGLDIRTSKTPGHTKLLLFFQVGRAFCLVDMPGYGFNQPANFIKSAEGFLQNRKNLRNTFLLIDSCVGLQQYDYVAIEMLEEFSIPYLVVLTKSDKASKRQLIESIMTVSKVIREHTHGCLPQPFLVSSKSGAGLRFLKGFIAYTTGNLQLQES